MSVQPIVNYPFLYINGAKITYASGTTLTVTPGLVRSSNNMVDMNIGNFLSQTTPGVAPANVTINAAVVGFNGIDTGALANNTFYYVYVIADSTGFHPTGALLSTSATAPLMPFGYDSFRRVGQVLTGGSATILLFTVSGNYYNRRYQYDAPIVVVSALGSATAVLVSLNAAVPVGSGRGTVHFNATYTPATAANSFSLRPTGGTGYPVVVSGPVVSQALKVAPFSMNAQISTATNIDWITTSGSDVLTLNVVGYDDYV